MQTDAFAFETLPLHLAYAVWRLRQDVFVVEQDCPYPDLDGRDLEPGTVHVVLRTDEGALLGYARVLDDASQWRIGRVVLAREARGRGHGAPLVQAAVDACAGRRDVVLSAQSPLVAFYRGFGFEVDGEEYVEDGIPHTPMRLRRE